MSTDVSRVAVVGDCPAYRYGLARVIDSAPDLEFAVGARSVAQAEGELESGDLLLLDLQEPPGALSATVSRLAARGVRVMVVYAAPPADIGEPIRAGARGCLSRQAGELELLAAIRLVVAGCRYISAVLAVGPRPCLDPPCRVTKREREILELVAVGETDHGIAVRLGISENTVHSHLDRLRDKIGSRRRADLTRFALSHDIVKG